MRMRRPAAQIAEKRRADEARKRAQREEDLMEERKVRTYLAEQAVLRASHPPPAGAAVPGGAAPGRVQHADTACAVPGGIAQGAPAAPAPPPQADAARAQPPAIDAPVRHTAHAPCASAAPVQPAGTAASVSPQHSAPAPPAAAAAPLHASRDNLAGLLDDVRQERARMQGQFDAHLALLSRQRDDTAVELRHMRVRALRARVLCRRRVPPGFRTGYAHCCAIVHNTGYA